MNGITANDIITLGDLPSIELNSILRRNGIFLSSNILNKLLKQVLITNINTESDFAELRNDTLKISMLSNTQLLLYIKRNYINLSTDTFMSNLWSIVLSSNLDISLTDIKMLLNKQSVSIELIINIFETLTQFVDPSTYIDGLTFLETQQAYQKYSSIEDLYEIAKTRNIKVSDKLDYNTFYKRILHAIGDNNYGGLENLSYENLEKRVKDNNINVDTKYTKPDLIKYILVNSSKNTFDVKNIDTAKITYSNLSSVDNVISDDISISTRKHDSELEKAISNVIDKTDNDNEFDNIFDELDDDQNEKGSMDNDNDGDEETSYNLHGVFDQQLINDIIASHEEDKMALQSNNDKLDEPISYVNQDLSLSSKIDEDLLNVVLEEESGITDKEESSTVIPGDASTLLQRGNKTKGNKKSLKKIANLSNISQTNSKKPVVETTIEKKEEPDIGNVSPELVEKILGSNNIPKYDGDIKINDMKMDDIASANVENMNDAVKKMVENNKLTNNEDNTLDSSVLEKLETKQNNKKNVKTTKRSLAKEKKKKQREEKERNKKNREVVGGVKKSKSHGITIAFTIWFLLVLFVVALRLL